jgi:hypothetical protein
MNTQFPSPHTIQAQAQAGSSEHAMEKKTRTADAGEASGSDGGGLVNRLPEALLVEVLGLLELDDACSASASCRALHAAGAAAISAITTLDLSVSLPPCPPHPPYRRLVALACPNDFPKRWGWVSRCCRSLLRLTPS